MVCTILLGDKHMQLYHFGLKKHEQFKSQNFSCILLFSFFG